MAITHKQQQIETDPEGYLLNRADWSPELAEQMAAEDDMSLTDAHWQVIHFVREFDRKYETVPAIRALVKALKLEFGPEIGNSIYLQQLFPDGPARQAARYAGLPKPRKCL